MSLLDLRDTAIFVELDRRANAKETKAIALRGAIDGSLKDVEKWLNEIRIYFRHFTDHTFEHSLRIISNIGHLLGRKRVGALGSAELYLIAVSAMLHDSGMVISESEAHRILNAEELQKIKNRLIRGDGLSGASEGFAGLDRYLIADYVRRRQGARVRSLLMSDRDWIRSLTNNDLHVADVVGRLCESHTLERSALEHSANFPTAHLLYGENVNLKFLSFCLRIGDLLDINTDRVCPMLQSLSEPLPFDSDSHWEQYRDIRILDLKPNANVRIGGCCHTQESERLLRDWVRWLEDEVEFAVLTFNSGEPKYRLPLGRVLYEVQPACNASGEPKYEFLDFRFNLDEDVVLKRLLGDRLYGHSGVAFRELMQNALDASRARAATTLARCGDWSTCASEQRLIRLREELGSNEALYRVRVSLTQWDDKRDEPGDVWWLTIEDNGVGMSRDVVSRYLLKVGRSRWTDDPTVANIAFAAIGRFGIGFLSALMISERIIVDSRSMFPDEPPICVTLYGWRHYAGTAPGTRSSAGTTIHLRLTPVIAASLLGDWGNLSQWCPYYELPVEFEVASRADTQEPLRKRLEWRGERVFVRAEPSLTVVSVATPGSAETRWDRFAMCQDGLWVADVVRPQGAEPALSVLRQWRISVDLRGEDRRELTLDRSMIEGEADRGWADLAPRLWTYVFRHRAAAPMLCDAVVDYVKELFYRTVGFRTVAVDGNGVLSEWTPDQTRQEDGLAFAEASRNDPVLSGRRPPTPTCNTLLVPAPDFFEDIENDLAYDVLPDDQHDPEVGQRWRSMAEWQPRFLKEWNSMGAAADGVDEVLEYAYVEDMRQVFRPLLNPIWRSVCRAASVIPVERGYTGLTWAERSLRISDIWFLRLTKNWWAIRSPTRDRELLIADASWLRYLLTLGGSTWVYEDLVLFVLVTCFPDWQLWSRDLADVLLAHKPLQQSLKRYDRRVVELLKELAETLQDEGEDEAHEKRMEWFKHEYRAKCVAAFEDEVAGSYKRSVVAKLFGPWEAEPWSAEEWPAIERARDRLKSRE